MYHSVVNYSFLTFIVRSSKNVYELLGMLSSVDRAVQAGNMRQTR